MIASSTLGFFSPDDNDLYTDSYEASLHPPIESCSTAVLLSCRFLEIFNEFFTLSKPLSAHKEVQIRIDFTLCSNNDEYCKIHISQNNETKTTSKPLSEYFRNALLRHSQSIYFPLFALSKFVLESIESVKNSNSPTYSILLSYHSGEIKSAIGLVDNHTSCDVIPLYYSGFLNALKNQSDWELVTSTFKTQSKLLSTLSKTMEFTPCEHNNPVVCDKVYYPQEAKSSDTSIFPMSAVTAESVTKIAAEQTRSIPTITTLCQAFANFAGNFLWRNYQHQDLIHCNEIHYSINDLEEISYISTTAQNTANNDDAKGSTSLRFILFYQHMYPLFASWVQPKNAS